MTIRVPKNAKKIDYERFIKILNKDKKRFNAKNFIGKFPFEGDSLEFQRELR